MPNQRADIHSRRCSAFTAAGNACSSWAERGSNPPRCHTHGMSEEELSAKMRKANLASRASKRRKKDGSEQHGWLAPNVTLEQILQVCTQALDARFEYTNEIDHGARLAACVTLLNVFPRSLRTTPEQARALLHSLLDGTRHTELAEVNIRESYRAMRKEWFDARMRCGVLDELYIEDLPPFLFGPGEVKAKVIQEEHPDLSAWKVRRLNVNSHVMVRSPSGVETLVPCDRLPRALDAA